MQKKFIRPVFGIVIAVFLFSAAGCVTAEKKKIITGSPIALVSVVSNVEINWKNEGPVNPNLISRYARRAMEADPDQGYTTFADIVIDEAEAIIRSMFDNSSGITLVPAAGVLGSGSYNEAQPYRQYEKEKMSKPEGYRYIYFRDKKFMAEFAAETGINRSLFITLDLTKFMSSGFGKSGNCRAGINMAVMLKDERGKTLFNKQYESNSRDQTKVSFGLYSQIEFRQMLLSAISDACYDLLDDLVY